MPAKVSLAERASVTAGLAKDVDAVNGGGFQLNDFDTLRQELNLAVSLFLREGALRYGGQEN
jgi:hypothetical protein